MFDQVADALFERFGGGEEKAAVEADDGDTGEGLVVGVLDKVTEDVRARLAAEDGNGRPGGDVDEPDERQRQRL